MPRSKGDRSESSNHILLASLLFIVSLVFFGIAYVNPALGTQSGIGNIQLAAQSGVGTGPITDYDGGNAGATSGNVNSFVSCGVVTPSGTGQLISVGVDVPVAAGNYMVAVYSDAGTIPLYTIAQSQSQVLQIAGWNDATVNLVSGVSSYTVSPSAHIWLCAEFSSSSASLL